MRSMPPNSGKKSNLIPVLLIAAGLLLSFSKPLLSFIAVSPAKLDVKIVSAPVIMPSIYKVYANSDAFEGKYSLFKMVVANKSSNAAENLEVSYQIPDYVETTVFQKINKILPGQTAVINCYPNLPEKIAEKTTPSAENVRITIKGSNIKTIENSFAIQCKGRNDFMYSFIPADEIRTAEENFDNKELLACLVTPEDPVIKYYTQKIQEKILKGEAAAVKNNEEDGVRFMKGIYEATYRSHMVYSGTSGVPEKIGDVRSIVQSIHLPREVVIGKTGLCIELSLLYASVMLCAGMDPVIYLIPGHAYPGFKMNDRYYAIESTDIGGEGIGGRATSEKALQSGTKKLEEFIKHAQNLDPDYMILDVRDAMKKGAIAMELKDDNNYLRQKIDEIAQSFDGTTVPVTIKPDTVAVVAAAKTNSGKENSSSAGNTAGLPVGYNFFKGPLSFVYPDSWKPAPPGVSRMPQCTNVLINSAKNSSIEVYNFQGYYNAEQAKMAIQLFAGRTGAVLQFKNSLPYGDFSVFNGTVSRNKNVLNWAAAFKNTGAGIAGIVIMTPAGTTIEETTQKILSTLQ